MDEIFLNKIKAFGFHGVLPEENRDGQWFFVSLKMKLSLAEAAATDDLEKTADYSRAAKIAENCVARRPPFKLIEKLAGTIAEEILGAFPQICEIEVAVHKPSAPIGVPCEDLGVRLVRRR